jgi:hypothetical protein
MKSREYRHVVASDSEISLHEFFCELHSFLVAGVEFERELDVRVSDDLGRAKYDFGVSNVNLLANFDFQ